MQLRSYRDDIAEFEQAGAVVLGISPQDVDSHEKWIAKERFPFALLADVDLTVAEAFDVKGNKAIPVKRSVFIVDAAGLIRYRYEGTVKAIFKKPKALAKILASI
jgi:peroxiredoxin Q/BCP